MTRPDHQVTIQDWQRPELIGWSFSHVEEILPTAVIGRGGSFPVELPYQPHDLQMLPVTGWAGETLTVADVVRATDTDAWLVLHGGQIVAEEYLGNTTPATRHLLQSVSKSLVSTVLGALVGRGLVDPHRTVADYVPDLAESGYGTATIRQVLDMRSGIGFREDYLDPTSDSRMLEATTGWAPLPEGATPGTLRSFIRNLRQIRPHGGVFEYRSCESDVLGLVCEGATGRRFPEIASELVWSRLGADHDALITVDSEGTGVFDGGICATLRDLARFGSTMVNGGRSPAGEQILPSDWVDDIFTGGDDSAQAFAEGPVDHLMPGGRYRSQFWLPTPGRDVALALGIHGQLIYLDRCLGLVGVKLSSWPEPQHTWKSATSLAMFAAISRYLVDGREPR